MYNDNLNQLLNALTETSVYVIETESRRLLYFNQRCQETGRGRAKLGAKCCDVWPEVCVNCPLEEMGSGSSSHIVCYDPLLKTTVDTTANRILWDGHIPAVVVTATPHKLSFEEEQGEKQIKKMYAQSLVTVFNVLVRFDLQGHPGGVSLRTEDELGHRPAGHCGQGILSDADLHQSDAEYIPHAGIRPPSLLQSA